MARGFETLQAFGQLIDERGGRLPGRFGFQRTQAFLEGGGIDRFSAQLFMLFENRGAMQDFVQTRIDAGARGFKTAQPPGQLIDARISAGFADRRFQLIEALQQGAQVGLGRLRGSRFRVGQTIVQSGDTRFGILVLQALIQRRPTLSQLFPSWIIGGLLDLRFHKGQPCPDLAKPRLGLGAVGTLLQILQALRDPVDTGVVRNGFSGLLQRMDAGDYLGQLLVLHPVAGSGLEELHALSQGSSWEAAGDV